jgi:hypothetical protein
MTRPVIPSAAKTSNIRAATRTLPHTHSPGALQISVTKRGRSTTDPTKSCSFVSFEGVQPSRLAPLEILRQRRSGM